MDFAYWRGERRVSLCEPFSGKQSRDMGES